MSTQPTGGARRIRALEQRHGEILRRLAELIARRAELTRPVIPAGRPEPAGQAWQQAESAARRAALAYARACRHAAGAHDRAAAAYQRKTAAGIGDPAANERMISSHHDKARELRRRAEPGTKDTGGAHPFRDCPPGAVRPARGRGPRRRDGREGQAKSGAVLA